MAKHLTYDDRLEIEAYLKENHSLSEISRKLNRHKSTISREITLRSTTEKRGCYGRNYNACIYRFDCDISKLCKGDKCIHSHKYCRFCPNCNANCQYFKKDSCEKLKKPPYVCNGCENRNKCTLTKQLCSAKTAQKDYERLLVESRVGKGVFSVKNIDLPRKVRYRPRKRYQMSYKVDKQCLEGRRYEDYLKFIESNKDISIVQMDTVEGRKGGKALLTIHFVDTSFMLMFIRDSNDAKSVTECFTMIYEAVGAEEF